MDLGQLTDDVEAVSERYAEAFGFERDDAWFLLKLQEEVGELPCPVPESRAVTTYVFKPSAPG